MDNMTLVTGAKKSTQNTDDKNNLKFCIENFSNEVIENSSAIVKIKEDLIELSNQGKLASNYLRPTGWKIFLNVLPSNETDSLLTWVNTVIEQRKLYKKRIKALNCLKKLSGDPLGKEKETQILKKIINLDVNRTFQDKQLFNTSFIKDLLCNILFLWAKENKDPCYKQGMNEILAIFVFAFYPYYFKNPYEKEQKGNNMQVYLSDPKTYEKQLYHFFHDEAELQSDLYFLFTNIMKQGASRFFENPKLEQVKLTGDCETYLNKRCSIIVHKKLQLYDKSLYDHFVKIELDCQIFLQRWLKCVFNREFHPRDVEVLWDGILSSEKKNEKTGLEMIDYISVAMIVFIKKELTGKDQNDCFQRLFKYPPIESTLTLVQLAQQIKLVNEQKVKSGVVVEKKKKQTEEHKINVPMKTVETGKKETNGKSISNENKPEKIIVSGPLLNSKIIHLSNKELLNEIDSVFKKYKFSMEITDVGNYELAMETLRKNLLNNQ